MRAAAEQDRRGILGRRVRDCAAPLGVVGALVLAGCSGGPAAISQPDFDPTQAGKLAMEEYDTDGDGYVAGEELKKAGSLNSSMATLDTDGDGRVSADEVAERVRAWQEMRTGLTGFNCGVTLNGKPLVGATVTFEPEPFLAEGMQTAVGTTNQYGSASLSIPKENRPSPDTPPGLPLGFYKVRISMEANGVEQLASRYNSETILGQQVAFDDPGMIRGRTFELESK